MLRSPSTKSTASSSPQSALKRTFKKSFSGSLKSAASDSATELPDTPLAVLRVQIVSCRDLPSADLNGKSDPYVVITFGNQRVKTPVVKKNLNPKYNPKEATFDLPILSSLVETKGALIDLVVWDKDAIGKDYLAEATLSPSQWFKRKDDGNAVPSPTIAYAFDDANNKPFTIPLVNNKPRKSRSSPTTTQPTIQVKIGLVPTDSNDLAAVHAEIVSKAANASDKLFSVPPTQALGAIRASTNQSLSPSKSKTMGAGQSSATANAKPGKSSFRINWEGTYLDYDFSSKKHVAGIVLLEIQGAKELPKVKNFMRTGFDMDPYVVIKYNDETFRTKVIRHELNPTFNDRFILLVLRPTSSASSPSLNTAVQLELLDWEQLGKPKPIGNAVLDLKGLIDAAPKPDSETGLYSVEAMRINGFTEMTLGVEVSQKEKWEGKIAPSVSVRACYDPNAAMRQRYWRNHLKDFDKDHSGQLSHSEIIKALEDFGLDTSSADSFFTGMGRDATKDELTIEETMICLEKDFGAVAEKRAEKEQEAKDKADEGAVKDALTAVDPDQSVDLSFASDAASSTAASPSPAPTAVVPDDDETEYPPAIPRPPRSSMFGHSRESIADLELQLRTIFAQHPKAYYLTPEDEEIGNVVVPASAIVDILATFSEIYEVELLGEEEKGMLVGLVSTMADAEIGPDFLITFLAKATGMQEDDAAAAAVASEEESALDTSTTPEARSPVSPNEHLSDPADDEEDSQQRGRDAELSSTHSRQSSRDSVVTSYRAGAGGDPQTPKASIFDVRTRSTPLSANLPPSSWSARPQPASRRRKSSVGSVNSRRGSESDEPAAGRHSRSASKSSVNMEPYNSNGSTGRRGSDSSPDEGQRSVSRPGSALGFKSLRLHNRSGSVSNPALVGGNGHSPERMPSSAGPSLESSRFGTLSDDDDMDNALDNSYLQDRFGSTSDATSLYSSNTADRIDELERIRDEQAKKLKEVQKTLEDRMTAHENDMEELMIRKEELEAELAGSRREEKELRMKDVNASNQLNALESEVARLQKELDTSKSSYQHLQKLYQEQCNEAEKHRDTLRRKDMELKDSERYVTVLTGDIEKTQAQFEASQELVTSLNQQLTIARDTLDSLERQKQENVSLKETIDRLRFEMDELRMSKNDPGSAGPSRTGTFVPSLAAEMQRRLLEHADAQRTSTRDGDDEDGYEETVITRRKIPRKSKTPPGGGVSVQDMFRDYSATSPQHDLDEFVNEGEVDAESEAETTTPTPEPSSSTPAPAEPEVPAAAADAPPSYSNLVEQENQAKLALSKWHSGRDHTDAIPEGITSDAIEEWKRVKAELGFSCQAVDEVLEKTRVTGPRPGTEKPAEAGPKAPSGPGGYESITKWTLIGVAGALCLFSFVSGYGVSTFFNRVPRVDRRLWDAVNDVAKAGSFPDLLHRSPNLPWSTVQSVKEHLVAPNWEPV